MKAGLVGALLLLALAVSISACYRTSPSVAPSPAIPVEQLLANPQAYAHQLVTLSGCYFSAFESSVLQPCQDASSNDVIWVENAALIHSIEQVQPSGIGLPEPQQLQRLSKPILVFKYDDATNRAAWNKLIPEALPPIYRSEVTVSGQFETMAPQVPGPMRGGFGHLNVFTHELILVEVLSSRVVKSGR